MKRLTWLVTLPLAVVIVVFAIYNRASVPVDPWPLGATITLPLYLVVLGALIIGFVAGGLVHWLSSGAQRQRVRQARSRIVELEKELSKVQAAGAASEPGGQPERPQMRLPAPAQG